MAGRLGWAMEKMGWRMPDESEELIEGTSVVDEAHEYPFSSGARPSAEPPFAAVRSHAMIEERSKAARSEEHGDRQRIITVHPRNYADALAVGEAFRDGIPVIMNLTDIDDAEARRIIDFAAGLTFGLHGAIERVTSRVFLLSPEGLEVTHDRAGSQQSLYR